MKSRISLEFLFVLTNIWWYQIPQTDRAALIFSCKNAQNSLMISNRNHFYNKKNNKQNKG